MAEVKRPPRSLHSLPPEGALSRLGSGPAPTESCLTLIAPPEVEEKLVDALLELAGDAVFNCSDIYSHGTAHGRLSKAEQVMGRSRAVQVQIVVDADALARLLAALRERFAGTGLRYWAVPLATQGEIA